MSKVKNPFGKHSRNVVFDFDGVIHSYVSKWEGREIIPDPPVEGIKEAIDEIRKKYNVVIVSTRTATESGKKAVKEWLKKYDITVDYLSDIKVPATAYVDDKAVYFDGNCSNLLEKIENTKSWNKEEHNQI